MERMTGIEPALSAWEADVLPLNYIRRVVPQIASRRSLGRPCHHIVQERLACLVLLAERNDQGPDVHAADDRGRPQRPDAGVAAGMTPPSIARLRTGEVQKAAQHTLVV
jgi:hypothetical protein